MNNSFLNLVMIQFREFVREPDMLFWSLVFPLVLSGVLGLAFANQEPLTHQVAVIQNQYAAANSSLQRLEAPSALRRLRNNQLSPFYDFPPMQRTSS